MTEEQDWNQHQREFDRLDEQRPKHQSPQVQVGYFIDDVEMLPESARSRATLPRRPEPESDGDSLRAEFDSEGRQVSSSTDSRDEQTELLRDLLEQVRTLPIEIVEAFRST